MYLKGYEIRHRNGKTQKGTNEKKIKNKNDKNFNIGDNAEGSSTNFKNEKHIIAHINSDVKNAHP